MDLRVTLTQIARLVRILVHPLDDGIEILLRLDLQNVVRVVPHSFLLLVDGLEQVSYLLDGDLILVLYRFDHALLEQLSDTSSQRLESLNVAFEHLALAALRAGRHLLLDHLHQRHALRCEMCGHLQALETSHLIITLDGFVAGQSLIYHLDASAELYDVSVEIKRALGLILALLQRAYIRVDNVTQVIRLIKISL